MTAIKESNSTTRWKKIGVIASSIGAVGTLIWTALSFATDEIETITKENVAKIVPEIIENKIQEHNIEVTKSITPLLTQLQRQMFDIQGRQIKSEIKVLTQNKKIQELTASEKSEFEYLIEEQKSIHRAKKALE